jgi:hypothetical protein
MTRKDTDVGKPAKLAQQPSGVPIVIVATTGLVAAD